MHELDFIDECYKNEDLSLLKKLTLVIPTYNRNYYLSRCLWYHAHFPFGQIIVADSSPEEKKIINRETVKKIRNFFNANILYLESEPETERYGRDIGAKWLNAIQQVNTEYIQIRTDKEFSNPETIQQCIEYLEEHKDFIAAGGQNTYLTTSQDGKIGIDVTSEFKRNTIIDAPSEMERFLQYLNNPSLPMSTQFCVHRTENFKMIYRSTVQYGVNDMRFGETAIELLPYILGNVKTYPDKISSIRDSHHFILSHTNTNGYAESSASRYLYPISYPYSLYSLLCSKLAQLFEDSVLNEFEKKKSFKKMIPKLISKRYPAIGCRYSKLIHIIPYGVFVYLHPLANMLWRNIPAGLREGIVTIKHTNDKIEIQSENNLFTANIIGIVNKFDSLYDNDTPINIYDAMDDGK